MSKISKDILKVALADTPESAAKEIIDERKRAYTFGLGSIMTTLGACSAPVDPNAVPPEAPERAQAYEQRNDTEIVVNFDDPDNGDPAVGLPGGAPPTGTSPVANPVNPNPDPVLANPAPSNPTPVDPVPTTPTPANPTPSDPVVQNPVPTPEIASQTFLALGPGLINIDASDMMDPNSLQLMSDGNSLPVWGFTSSDGAAFNGDLNRLCPGPVIEANEGELTTIALRSQMPHTLHLHGMDVNQANDGVPSTSGFVSQMDPGAPGTPPPMRILNPPGAWLGNPFEYIFTAPHAGTYMYHCHVDTVLHMEMGMSGTIIVRPPDGNKNALWSGGPIFDREYIWQLHTFDSTWHASPLGSGAGTLRYNPDYFMLNGRDGLDILSDPTASIEAYAGQQIVIRLVNLGYQPAVVNLGGIPFDILASDGRPVKKLFLNLFTEMTVGPGERYDIMFAMPPSGVTNASVDYLDIMGRTVLGTAVSSITTL